MYLITEFETVIKQLNGKISHSIGLDNAVNFSTYEELECFLSCYFGTVVIFKRESVYLIVKNENNKFLSAKREGFLGLDQDIVDGTEVFRAVDGYYANLYWNGDGERLKVRISELQQKCSAVKLHVACGSMPIEGFLNIDYTCHAPEFATTSPEQYYLMHTAGSRIHLLDNCIDYIFHEHFIEHICQFDQICFLAEAYRILKTGGVHRVNAPDLISNFTLHSNFSKGYQGVHKGDKWHGHIGYLTADHLKEIAKMIGYREVHIKKRGDSISPYAIRDRRPFENGADDGNLFIDLVK
jgi:predicted SAM-dependent methyltransferase